MINDSEFQSVEVFYLKTNELKLKKEKYYFRFLYVIRGNGTYTSFDNTINYQKGTLVLITPDDGFDFQIKKESEFLVIQFHLKFLTGYRWKTIPKIEEILSYIESNIHKPDLLKAKLICSIFGISTNYFSNYFKINCGTSFKDYIASYRIKLIKHRLLFGDKRMRELAEEFGFTDISHLNRYFKNNSGVSVRDFKNNQKRR